MKHNRFITGRIALILALLTVLTLCLPACSHVTDNGKKALIFTVFPEYDWGREVLGQLAENYNVKLLLDSGVDLHSYQPTVADMSAIAACDLFVYIGGESDAWVSDALAVRGNENRRVLCLMDVVEAKEEALPEGAEEEEEHDREDGHDEETEYDEHIWLSLRNAEVCVSAIAEALALVDGEHGDTYRANGAAYIEKLKALDGRYTDMVATAVTKSVVVADRFPFRYLTDDYGLTAYAAFSGCSTDSNASFQTITFLSGKVDELGLGAVLIIENSDGSVAATVVEHTALKNQQILTLHSCQAVSGKDVASGVTYLGLMEQNLAVLAQALGATGGAIYG